MADPDPPRLTYLITGLQYGGATMGMVRLLSELSPKEYDVTVVSIADTSPDVVPLIPDHATTYHLGIGSKLSLHELRPVVNVLRETDILVTSLFHATAVGVPLGKALGVPRILVWQHNTTYKHGVRSLGYRAAYRLADGVLADSDAVRSMLVNEQGMADERIATLPIAGVDTDRFRPGDRREERADRLQVGTIGRLAPQKGYPELIECARRLGTGYRFTVIGDGPMRETLASRAPENVVFLGRVDDDDLVDRLRSFDVYFQPSRHEGLCMTVIEAMACGLPIVASSVGGITESVVPGETGFLCEAGDVGCYCEHLEHLREAPDTRLDMGENSRERVVDRYSAAVLADSFREVLAESTNHGTVTRANTTT